jgi:hypothetical protein
MDNNSNINLSYYLLGKMYFDFYNLEQLAKSLQSRIQELSVENKELKNQITEKVFEDVQG